MHQLQLLASLQDAENHITILELEDDKEADEKGPLGKHKYDNIPLKSRYTYYQLLQFNMKISESSWLPNSTNPTIIVQFN